MNEEVNYFQETKRRLKQYIERRILLMRLQATQKLTRVFAVILTIVVVVITALFLLMFASFAAGYWLADVTGSLTTGFGIVALFYLIIFLFVIFFLRKILQNFFINKFIHLLNKRD